MKFYLSILLILIFFLNINAQNLEPFSELTPYSEWLNKTIEEYKKANIKVINKPFWSKARHFLVKGIIGDKSELVNFSSKVEIKKLEIGESIVSTTFESNYKEFAFEDVGGKQTARIRFFGRIFSKDKNFDKVFEEYFVLTSDLKELLEGKGTPIFFKKLFKLPKGKYNFKFIITDISFGKVGIKTFKFEIK